LLGLLDGVELQLALAIELGLGEGGVPDDIAEDGERRAEVGLLHLERLDGAKISADRVGRLLAQDRLAES
jgi:hypothetical protein